jgi:hypothetical protein
MDLLPNKDNKYNKAEIDKINVKIKGYNDLNNGLIFFREELRKENQNIFSRYNPYNPYQDDCVKKISKTLTNISD